MSDDTLPVGLMIIAFLLTFLVPVGGVSVQERLSAAWRRVSPDEEDRVPPA